MFLIPLWCIDRRAIELRLPIASNVHADVDMLSTVQAEADMFRRLLRCMPYVTPLVYSYLVRKLPAQRLLGLSTASPGAIMTTKLKSELINSGADAWRMADAQVLISMEA